MAKKKVPTVLVLWNQTTEDVYEKFKQDGPKPLEWAPDMTASEVGTVQDELDQLIEAIRANGYRAHIVNVQDDYERLLAAVTLYEPDIIFNLIEYFYDDETLEPNVAALYELLDIPYTGNPPLTLATCQNKVRTKVLLDDAGLPTAPFMVCKVNEKVPDPEALELNYPLIVKPALEDASGGIEPESVVQTLDQLETRCKYIWKEWEQPALVEEYIEGREIHAAVLGNFIKGKRKPVPEGQEPPEPPEWLVEPKVPEVLPLFEMEFDDSELYNDDEWRPQIISYKAKWDPHSKQFYTMDSVCPPEDLEPEIEETIRTIALQAYRVMGCRDYARIDMRVDEEGDVFILEVNPNPDLADGSAYVMCSDASGRTYAQLIGEVVKLALARAPTPEQHAAKRVISDHLLREYAQRGTVPKDGRGAEQVAASIAAGAAAATDAALEVVPEAEPEASEAPDAREQFSVGSSEDAPPSEDAPATEKPEPDSGGSGAAD